jgi:hypothetical protein
MDDEQFSGDVKEFQLRKALSAAQYAVTLWNS